MTPVLDSSSCLIMLWKDGDWHISQKSGPGPFDRGFTLGDGLFETLLWYEKGIHRLAEHHRRLSQSAHSLGFPPPPSVEVLANLSQKLALARTIEGKGALRLSLSRGAGQRGLSPPPYPFCCSGPDFTGD